MAKTKATKKREEDLYIELPARLMKRLEAYAARVHQSQETICDRAVRAVYRKAKER